MADTAMQWQNRREARDVSGSGLMLFGVAFLSLLLIASAALWLVFGPHGGGFSAARHLGEVANDTELYQRDQLAKYRAAQAAELARLDWSGSGEHFAKVPIDDAMRLLAAKGAQR